MVNAENVESLSTSTFFKKPMLYEVYLNKIFYTTVVLNFLLPIIKVMSQIKINNRRIVSRRHLSVAHYVRNKTSVTIQRFKSSDGNSVK